MKPEYDFKKILKKFGDGRTKYVVRFLPTDAFNKSSIWKNHRDYIRYLFKEEHNMEVIQFNHNYNDDGSIKNCGLIFTISDSVIETLIEVHGIEGVSVRGFKT